MDGGRTGNGGGSGCEMYLRLFLNQGVNNCIIVDLYNYIFIYVLENNNLLLLLLFDATI